MGFYSNSCSANETPGIIGFGEGNLNDLSQLLQPVTHFPGVVR